ncbi:putative homeodomain-interacting protein kinase 2-like [Scophthalmus maximus]|uniref:Putative homeodomain-interacting protein kinase 2-like n=1 Tax=Scophthalmus maximus TaxID=52904 RepID=A0A2U9BLB5_SCOMX|nr:putative homeodomain-interacting protein kinase 2-like [Scophthalmus maximus]
MDPDIKGKDSEVKMISISKISKGYIRVKLLGEGDFGKVYKCLSLQTKDMVALKIVQKDYGKRELDTLKALRELGHDKHNLVRLDKHHEERGMVYLEFELLDITILEYMEECHRPLPLSEIQAIAQQMLVALNALKSKSLVHADIEPSNIMFANHKLQPMKVKLIGFGVTIPVNTVAGEIYQIPHFRGPEVLLGLPLSEATDMWGLGSVLAYMYLDECLHTGQCKYQEVINIVQMHGQPADYMLTSGKHTEEYFCKDRDSSDSSWGLIDNCDCRECKYSRESSVDFETSIAGGRVPLCSLDEIVLSRQDTMEYGETLDFLSLLKQMLEVDPRKRITPSKALQHPFMTLKHFPSDSSSNPHTPPACLAKQECQSEQCNAKRNNVLVGKGADAFSTSMEIDAFSNEDPLPTACANEVRITSALLHEASSPASASRDPDGGNTCTDERASRRNTCYVEVKTRTKYLKKIRQFFSSK